MANKKLLAELEFGNIISEAAASTATGQSLINKYKSHIMTNEATCRLVNSFISEANQHLYDNGVYEALSKISDYIQSNKTGWALLTACESLKQIDHAHGYLHRNAVSQVEKLLENNEETINKYIKAGALKSVMYVTEFRNIAKQVYHDMPIVEAEANFTMIRPISFIESDGTSYTFEAAGKVIVIDSASKTITEGTWDGVSNTFKIISSLLESNICSFDETSESLTINYLGSEYVINEAGKCEKCKKDNKDGKKKEMTVEQLRDENALFVRAQNPRNAATVAQVLEAIALTCENFSKIMKMDNTGIYTTNSDRFLVVCEGTNMYTTLLNSNHSAGWTFNTNVIEALEGIEKNTRVSLSEKYNGQVKQVIENTSEEDRIRMENELKEGKINDVKKRIEALTEKFKNDPVKLAILSQCAKDLQSIED